METHELSPIVVIKQKELELSERLAAARLAAKRAILEARQWATDHRDQAEREGQEQATAFFRAELEACDAEAEKIRADGELSARWIAERGSRGLDQAMQCILEIILPPLPYPSLTSLESREAKRTKGGEGSLEDAVERKVEETGWRSK
jgi:vacuolar-type H+-ATPase subunit H